MNFVAIAENIARLAHAGQVEKYGDAPYITHIERVVAGVTSDDAKAVAWLHDVLEDTSWTEHKLRKAGIPRHVVEAVVILTRVKPMTYADYIDTIKVSGDPLALAVKVADLKDHLRANHEPPGHLRPRYVAALALLNR